MQPNRLSAPGEHAARARVETIFERIDEIGMDSLVDIVITPPDPDARAAMLDQVQRTATTCGRLALLDEALGTVRDALVSHMASRLPAGTYTIQVRRSARVEDRVAVQEAIEDAVLVAVVEDVLDPDVAQALAEPGRTLLGLPPLGRVPDERAGAADAATPQAWAPTEADWAAADHGPTVVEHGMQVIAGLGTMRTVVIVIVMLVGILGALTYAAIDSSPVVGLVISGLIAIAGFTMLWPRPRD